MASSAIRRFALFHSQGSTQREPSRRSLLARLGITIALVVTALWNVVLASLAWQGVQAVIGISW
jgi:hypothetical protein